MCVCDNIQVRHLLAGADWSAPKCRARSVKTLEQIIHLIDTFPVSCGGVRMLLSRRWPTVASVQVAKASVGLGSSLPEMVKKIRRQKGSSR